MKLPKELTTILFITLPILFFFIGLAYPTEPSRLITVSIPTQPKKLTVPSTLQQPYAKVSINGIVTLYDLTPAKMDGSPLLKVRIPNGIIFEIVLPSGRSSCTVIQETYNTIQTLKVGDAVEVYGTAAPNERITVCNSDEFVKITP